MLLLELTAEEQRYEVYIKAALELMASNGEAKPQVRELVKIVGGSTTTAKHGMHAFWSYLDRLIDYRSAYSEKVAPEVIEMCEKLLITCREQASSEFTEKRAELIAERDQLKDAVEQQQKFNQEQLAEQQAINAQLQEESAELKKLYESAKAEHSQITALLENSESKLAAVEAANIELNKSIATLEQGASNQQAKIDELHASIKDEMTKRAAQASELELAKQQQLIDKEAISGLEHRLDIAQNNLGSLQANYVEKTNQFDELKVQLQQQQANYNQDKQQLNNQVDKLSAALADTKQQLQDAMVLAAKAQVYEEQLAVLTATLNKSSK